MKNGGCSNETAVIRAMRSGNLPETVRTHVASCPICRETVRVAAAMHKLAQEPAGQSPLPSADLILWKARLAERQRETRRAERPLMIAETLLSIVAALTTIAWLGSNLSAMESGVMNSLVALLPQLGNTAWTVLSTAPTLTSPLFLAIALVFLVAFAIAAPLLAQD